MFKVICSKMEIRRYIDKIKEIVQRYTYMIFAIHSVKIQVMVALVSSLRNFLKINILINTIIGAKTYQFSGFYSELKK